MSGWFSGVFAVHLSSLIVYNIFIFTVPKVEPGRWTRGLPRRDLVFACNNGCLDVRGDAASCGWWFYEMNDAVSFHSHFPLWWQSVLSVVLGYSYTPEDNNAGLVTSAMPEA